jgi:serine/threonine protein kinase
MTPGTRLGPYEIVAPLGAGGMGEVYKARDTRLDRSVAVKILPADFAENAQLKLRFEREAKTISQLNHPHICTLYDVGDGYLVMELLEGETLAERVVRGPLPVAEVLKYGIQIAEALEKAHKAGVIHRDLKPGNIMITKNGAKLLDFGLAKSGIFGLSAEGSTALKPLTAEGTIVGTFQYMAPEQLEGGEADARTDIFAFGTVLYEMATGQRAFQGKTRTSLIAAIVSGEPEPLSHIQPLAPAALERLIRKCLAKDPDDRWQCAADLKWDLLRIQEEPTTRQVPRSSRVAWGIAVVALVASFILAAIALRPDKPARPVRFSVGPPAGWTISLQYNLGPPAVSPDGRYVAFTATDDLTARALLWIRDLAATEPVSLPGTEGAGFVFWSPDSKSIGFFSAGYLKRIDLNGGPPQVLCPAASGRGGSWSEHNEIIFAPSGNGPLYRVAAGGGVPQQLTRLDPSRGESSHRLPYFLPDGKHFLFTIRTLSSADRPGDSIYVASVDSPVPRPLLEVSSNVAYAEPGYLLFLRDRTLLAQRFNTRTLRLEGEPRAVTSESMQYHPVGFGLFSSSRSGALVFGTGSLLSKLQWLDRDGRAEPAIASTGNYLAPRLSRDQQQILYGLPDAVSGNLDLWLYDIERRISRRVTFHPRDDFSGVLTPDGSQMIFSSNRGGFPNLYSKAVDASDEKLLFPSQGVDFAESISADGRALLFRRISPNSQNDLFTFALNGGVATPFATTPFNEVQPVFSPTGRWVAYVSNESGRYQVYAARYPGGGSRVQISPEGGSQPVWRGDEKELFYVAPGDRVMSVPIDTSSGLLKPGTPTHVFDVSLRPARDEEREYDVSRDGRRFIVNAIPPDKRSIPITVVINWQTDLQK